MTAADLAAYEAKWREPVRFAYRGHTVISMPPASSGGVTMAEILKILEGYDLRSMGHHSTRHVHLWAEAVKRAYADRNAYLADPDFVPQPTARMISDAYAAERRATIQPERATPSSRVEPGLGPTREDVLEAVTTRLEMSRKQAAEAYALAETYEENPRSVWGYVQGLTRLSQRTPWQDGRFNLDQAASRLIATVN